jgi:hypothetical protein
MQIHEITHRSNLSEAGFGAGLATGLQGALSKVGVQGPALEPSKFAGPSMDRSQAYAAAVRQANTLMPLMRKSWDQAIQKIMSTSVKDGHPITSLKELNPAEMDNLQSALDTIINKNIGAQVSYTQLPHMTSDGQAKAGAQKIVLAINTARDAILNAAKEGTDAGPAWQDLMTDGIAPAMNFQAFDRGGYGSTGGVRISPGQAATRPTGLPYPDDYEINLGQGWVTRDFENPQHMAFLRKQAGLA